MDKMYRHKIHENLKLTKINIHTVSIRYLTNAPYNAIKIIMSYPANFYANMAYMYGFNKEVKSSDNIGDLVQKRLCNQEKKQCIYL